MSASRTVADCPERELIARIRGQLPPAPAWMLVGIGDDAAVVEPERNRVEVLTVDALVEGIHFDRAFVPPDAIGHRALAVNLSDLAAMGAAPRLALLSMALPARAAARRLRRASWPASPRSPPAIGCTSPAATSPARPGPLMIDVTVMGTVKRRQALTRSGARPGDDIYVSGTVGAAARRAAARVAVGSRHVESTTQTADQATLSAARAAPAPRRPPRPEPGRLRVHGSQRRAGRWSSTDRGGERRRHDDRRRRAADRPGRARVLRVARPGRRSIEALTGGDDYELLIAVRPRTQRRLTAAMQRGDVVLTRIGRCTAERGITLRGADGGVDSTPRALPHGLQPLPMIHLTKALVRRWLDTLLHVADTPERTAAAFAMGVFFGFSPFLGFHTMLAIIVAFCFDLNRVAALLGVYSNLPWIIAPYYAIVTMIGAKIIGHAPPESFKASSPRCSNCRCSTANSGIS